MDCSVRLVLFYVTTEILILHEVLVYYEVFPRFEDVFPFGGYYAVVVGR